MHQKMVSRHHHQQIIKRHKIRPLSLIAAALLFCLLFCSCSGTGTMFTPDTEESSAYGTTDDLSADRETGDGPEAESGENSGHGSAGEDSPEEEEPRRRRAFLEGTGSDLFPADTVDYYYNFTLEGVPMVLPCSFSVFSRNGWELQIPDAQENAGNDTAADRQGDPSLSKNEDSSYPAKTSGTADQGLADNGGTGPSKAGAAGTSASREGAAQQILIPGWSYEFFDASPAGEEPESTFFLGGEQTSPRTIRLCLANYTASPLAPEKCRVCGIQAAADSGFTLQTVFGTGIGSSIEDLTAVYGTDVSIWKQTRYRDGTVSLLYRFSNGLTEGERIPVLAEAEEKALAELLLAETDTDGKTINSLSLYYFRLPK